MKKTKQIIQLMLLTVALGSSALLAQSNLSFCGSHPVQFEFHFGTSNKYPIGTSDNPVRATEYCDYLNAMAPNDRPWIESNYYDRSFMETSQDWPWDNITRAAIYRTGTSGSYSYFVISGCENCIIDAVYSPSIQQEFNTWRAANAAALAKNPSRQELCDYINDKIAGQLDPSYLDKATEIHSRYPDAAELTFRDLARHSVNYSLASNHPLEDVAQTLWAQINSLVDGIYGNDTTDNTLCFDEKGNAYTITTHRSASDASCNDFLQRWGLVISEDPDPSFPVGMPKHVVLLDPSQQEIHLGWAALFPANVGNISSITVSCDSVVVAKIPYNPPASDNSGTPAPEAPVPQN